MFANFAWFRRRVSIIFQTFKVLLTASLELVKLKFNFTQTFTIDLQEKLRREESLRLVHFHFLLDVLAAEGKVLGVDKSSGTIILFGRHFRRRKLCERW